MAKRPHAKVTKVNPSKKKAKKKVAKKKAAKKKPAKKKAAKKKPAKKKASKTNPRKKKPVAKKKKKKPSNRRKRPATKAKSAPRRSKKNPALTLDIKQPFMHFLPRTIGQMVTAAVVYKWGDPAQGSMSPTAGYQWSMKNYFIGYITSLVGGELIGRFAGKRAWGQQFYNGGVELMTTKALWTEVFARVPMLHQYLGQGEGRSAEFQALAAQATEGDVIEDPNGTTWLLQNGQWVSMQGSPYQAKGLAGHDPYAPKELAGVLTDEDYLGGVLTDEDYLGRIREVQMGHAMPSDTSRSYATQSQYQDTGSPDPFHNLYQQ